MREGRRGKLTTVRQAEALSLIKFEFSSAFFVVVVLFLFALRLLRTCCTGRGVLYQLHITPFEGRL